MESYTYSNIICPHCHSGEVVWRNITTETSSTSKLMCLHCQHIFDPPTIQLQEKKTRYFPTITLCGSTRFRDMFLYLQKELTLEGYIVLSVGCFGHYETGEEAKRIEDSKKLLDEIHKRKIDMSDAIYVINPGGYIGDSTQSEIEYAKMNNKEIYYLIPPRKKYLN